MEIVPLSPVARGSETARSPPGSRFHLSAILKGDVYMRRVAALLAAMAFLAALPTVAETGVWTSIASAGAIDPTATGIYSLSGATLTYSSSSTSTSPIIARYNVTNTWGASDTPPWDTLEIGYLDTNSSVSVRAELFQVNPCTGVRQALCVIFSSDSASATCKSCSFAPTIDFGLNTYYVEVALQRSSATAPRPVLYTLRIH